MTPDQFAGDLDRYGPNLARWPAPAAQNARDFLDTSAEARTLLRQAAGIEARLRRPAPDVTALKARIMAAARAGGQAIRDNVVPFPTRRVVTPAAIALAASLVFGIFAGWSGMISDPLNTNATDDAESYTIQALMTGDNYDS